MFKYKWDKMQMAIMITYFINALVLLYFPYKLNTLDEITYYGYKAFLHWVIMLYLLRVCMHVFGMEVYNMKANVIGLYAILGLSTYFKIFLGRRENMDILWSGTLIPVLSLTVVVALLILDSQLYELDKK